MEGLARPPRGQRRHGDAGQANGILRVQERLLADEPVHRPGLRSPGDVPGRVPKLGRSAFRSITMGGMAVWDRVRGGFDLLWNGRHSVLFFRNVAALAIAIVLCLVPEAGPSRFGLAAFLVFVCIPAATWLERSFPIAETAWIQPLFDLGVLVTAIHFVPSMWFPALVLGLVIVQAPSVAEKRRSASYHALFAVILTAGMTLAAIVHDVPDWELPVLAMVVLYPSVIYYAHRQATRTNELRDRASALEGLRLVAGGVAHDFNNLLTGVMGHAELALDQLDPDAPARDSLEAIVNGTTRASLLSARLLAFAGRDTETDASLDLEAEVGEIVALMRPAVPKGIELELRSALQGARVRARPMQLQQIVMNLILNASEAGQELPSRVRIDLARVSAPSGEAWLELSVRDDGVGIPAEVQPRVFEAHFTLKAHGNGLGLAGVRTAVAELGGRIEIESVEGEGTTVRVRLPEERAVAPVQETRPPAVPEPGHLALVVDDEAAIRGLLSRMLTGLGYTVRTASDGPEAIELTTKHRAAFDVVLLDLRMPGMDGWECLRRLREIRDDLPVVVCSGHDPSASGARPDDPRLQFLAKPFRRAALREALARASIGSRGH
jgi:signal transduction histidine kinase/CheY-like chemotaxis protein